MQLLLQNGVDPNGSLASPDIFGRTTPTRTPTTTKMMTGGYDEAILSSVEKDAMDRNWHHGCEEALQQVTDGGYEEEAPLLIENGADVDCDSEFRPFFSDSEVLATRSRHFGIYSHVARRKINPDSKMLRYGYPNSHA